MKKTSKILGGLFAVLLVGTIGTNMVKAETLEGLGNNGKDASVASVYEPDIYSVDINWGSMRYTYYKVSDDNYAWHGYSDGYKLGNYVEVTNNSTKDIKATLSWESSIAGVNAIFNHSDRLQGRGTCADAKGLIATTNAWSDNGTSGVYRMSSNHEEIIYSDDTCETYVEAGTVYDDQTTYYTVQLENIRQTNNSNNAVIPAPVLYGHTNFPIVGYYNTQLGSALATTTTFTVELEGGYVDNVKAAYNTETKKIGTVTVTITDAE